MSQEMADTRERVRDFLVEEGGWQGARSDLTDDLPLIPTLLPRLLAQDVAEHAALLRREVGLRAVHFVAHLARHNRQRDELRVRVIE